MVDHVQRVNESIDGLREVLAFSFEAALLLQSARQGDIQRRFTGWAAILAVPTAIAGIYGMNFDFMPELNVRFGYFTVLAVILAICLYLFYRFRRAGWVKPCGIREQVCSRRHQGLGYPASASHLGKPEHQVTFCSFQLAGLFPSV